MENHQVVFLFGDLNYRINMPREVVMTSVMKKSYDILKDQDELIQSVKQYKDSPELQFQLYRDFTEGDI